MVLMVRVCVGRVHDLGGHDVARDLWTDYFVACNAVIYLVDCNDRERFLEMSIARHWQFDTLARAHYSTMMMIAILGGAPEG